MATRLVAARDNLITSRAIIGMYYARLEQNPGLKWIEAISSYFESDQGKETYPWLGQAPGMSEWKGARRPKELPEHYIEIENRDFEQTVKFKLAELRRDKTGQVKARIQDLADRTNSHWAKLLSDLIARLPSTVCYDGQYFFDTDHAEGESGAQSNMISVDISELPCTVHGTATAPSVEEMALAILQGITTMYGFKDDQGEPMNEAAREFLVQVPLGLWNKAQNAVKQPQQSPGQSNIIQTMDDMNITVVPNPRLSWTNKFIVWRTDASLKPLIRQEEVMVQMTAIAEGSEHEKLYKEHLYMVDTSRNVGAGYWQFGTLVELV